MNRTLLFVLIGLAFCGEAQAQKKAPKKEEFKPAVLVIGNRNAAISAAIQSARSGVQTAILLQAGGFDLVAPEKDIVSGFQLQFQKKYTDSFLNKTASADFKANFDKQKANALLTAITDTVKNLKVIRSVMWTKANRSGNSWSFRLADGTTIRPKVLIASTDSRLNETLNLAPANVEWSKIDYSDNLYRTSLTAGKSLSGSTATTFSLKQLLVKDEENLVWLSDPESMELGQAAGATAAYAAFFDTKTSASNLKTIQGELVHYKLNLIPFADISPLDSNWKAIQLVGLTGVIKGDLNAKQLLFSPNKIITTADIRQPLKDYFYKAQLWFDDHKSEQLSIASALDLIAYVGNKSIDQMKREIERNWKANYHFTSNFDLNRQITRKELAVLLQDYMPPFNVNIDDTGRVVR
ncbi:MAG: hypothetical protein REI78_05630 [Pedobacter sp.]|nr:hypothetical protein [Pedobacter sp.]MDQ8052482.1 hypothetical protein [Pedobacter sp.]